MRHPEGDLQYLDKHDQLAASGTDSEEMYANVFAAALPMSAAGVQKLRDRIR